MENGAQALAAPRRSTRTRKRTLSQGNVPNPLDDLAFNKEAQQHNEMDLLGFDDQGDAGTGLAGGDARADAKADLFAGFDAGSGGDNAKLEENFFDIFGGGSAAGAKATPDAAEMVAKRQSQMVEQHFFSNEEFEKKMSLTAADEFAFSWEAPDAPQNPFDLIEAGASNPFSDAHVGAGGARHSLASPAQPPARHLRQKSAPQLFESNSASIEKPPPPTLFEEATASESDSDTDSEDDENSSEHSEDFDDFNDADLNLQQMEHGSVPARSSSISSRSLSPPLVKPAKHRRVVSVDANTKHQRSAGSAACGGSLAHEAKPRGHRRAVSVDAGRQQKEALKMITEEKDALKVMREGTSFLKYGRMGYPHFRMFHLTPDNQTLVWYSKNKKRKSTQISIHDIDQIISGQKTKNFHRHRAPELARSSFSIIYGNQRKSLDVVAKSPQEHALWVQGLQSLRDAARKNESHDMHELIVRLKTYKKAEDSPGHRRRQSARPRYSAQKALKELQSLQRIWHRFDLKLNSPKISGSLDYEKASAKVEQLRKEMDEISLSIRNGELLDIDFRLWKIAVEIEAIENMLHVIGN